MQQCIVVGGYFLSKKYIDNVKTEAIEDVTDEIALWQRDEQVCLWGNRTTFININFGEVEERLIFE